MRTVLDGGMGRELKRVGAPFRQPEWSALALMEAPEQVTEVHLSFIEAGADVITTNNYAVVPYHLGEALFEEQGDSLTALAGDLARKAVTQYQGKGHTGRDSDGSLGQHRLVKVGGSLPPLSGSYRPDLFDTETATMVYPRIVAALDPYIDIWMAETMSSIEEAASVQNAIQHSDKPFWISFTLTDELDLDEPCLRSGESLYSALEFAHKVNADAMLFNCSLPEVIGQALKRIGELRDEVAPELRIGGYGNTFTPRGTDAEAKVDVAEMREEVTPQHYSEIAKGWEESGAEIIGGCCGIGPQHIAALAKG